MVASASTEQRIVAESAARRELQSQIEAAIGKRSSEIQQLDTQMKSFQPAIQSALAETNAKLDSEQNLRAAALEKLEKSLASLTQELDSKVAQTEATINERMASMEGELKAEMLEVKDSVQNADQQQKDMLQELLGQVFFLGGGPLYIVVVVLWYKWDFNIALTEFLRIVAKFYVNCSSSVWHFSWHFPVVALLTLSFEAGGQIRGRSH